MGFSNLLMEEAENMDADELRKIGKNIHASGTRLFRLIQNYLLYAQLELKKTGKVNRTFKTSAGEVCLQMGKRIAARYNRNEDFRIEGVKETVSMPETEFKKILEELLDNAFKFSKSGQKVTLTCREERGVFFLEVHDRGRGIKKEDLVKIGAFIQFERTMDEQQGFGLGLVISKKIAELFDGALKIESESDQWTMIKVTIPNH